MQMKLFSLNHCECLMDIYQEDLELDKIKAGTSAL